MDKIISFIGSGALLTKAVNFSIANGFTVEKVFCTAEDSAIPFLKKQSVDYHEVNMQGLGISLNQAIAGEFKSDVIFSINNRFLLSDEILNCLNLPVINIHNGLVQSYRGVAEICVLAALCNNELVYGATCHQILTNQEVDTGRVLLQKSFKIESHSYSWLMSKAVKNCQEAFEEFIVRFFSEKPMPDMLLNFSNKVYTYASILEPDSFSFYNLQKINLGIYNAIFPKIKNYIEKRIMKDKIIEVLCLVRPEFDFSESDSFIEDGLLDSFDLISLVTYLDEEFGISIEGTDIVPENFMNLTTIETMLNKYVRR